MNHRLQRFPVVAGSLRQLAFEGDSQFLLNRWKFSDVLNYPLSINDEAIQCLPQLDMNPDLDIPPCEDEVAKAIKQMSSGKAPGFSPLTPSLLRCSSQVAHLSFKS